MKGAGQIRADAKEVGLKRYLTGQPCRRGHLAERFVRNGECVACKALADLAYSKANPDKLAAKMKVWKEANREHMRQYSKAYYSSHSEKHKALTTAWAKRNPEKVRAAVLANDEARKASAKKYRDANTALRKQRSQKYQRENKHMVAANAARRRARRLRATPQWADQEAIKAIYELASKQGLHVDHVIPLANPKVCGLHVETNLQLLTPRENLAKGNRLMAGFA